MLLYTENYHGQWLLIFFSRFSLLVFVLFAFCFLCLHLPAPSVQGTHPSSAQKPLLQRDHSRIQQDPDSRGRRSQRHCDTAGYRSHQWHRPHHWQGFRSSFHHRGAQTCYRSNAQVRMSQFISHYNKIPFTKNTKQQM